MNGDSILTKAMEATSPPLSWSICEHEALGSTADAVLDLRINEGSVHRFTVEVKAVVRIETLKAQEAKRSKNSRHPRRLLVVPYLSKHNADLFLEAGLNFIDTAGNAFIDVPGCYVFISGKQRREQEPTSSGHEVMEGRQGFM